MNLLGMYRNGNYIVRLFEDGTKIRETINDEDLFKPEFPESIDLKITNKCDMNCKMCHEDSHANGLHGDINSKFIDTIKPYTEVAIGGGNPLEHPDLLSLLVKFKRNHVIANMTVNQIHFMKNKDFIKFLLSSKLINGLGISYMSNDKEFINEIKNYNNVVLHVIAGLISSNDIKSLYNNNIKLLILGYKQFRKGLVLYSDESNKTIIDNNIDFISNSLEDIFNGFKVVAFDNLAIKQLNIENILKKDVWDNFYQGDDGSHTFYIDLVTQQFALNSTSETRYALQDDITEMFKVLNKSL